MCLPKISRQKAVYKALEWMEQNEQGIELEALMKQASKSRASIMYLPWEYKVGEKWIWQPAKVTM